MRRIVIAFLVVVLGLLGSIAVAQAKDPLWQSDGALVNQVAAAARAGGIAAVGPQAGALKQALAGAKGLFPGPIIVGGKSYVLTDGAAETAVVLAKLVGGKADVAAFANPYPVAALMLGSYYNETGKFGDAIKALDAGLTLSPLPKEHLGDTVPDLYSERGVAFTQLKRWKEALASYDAGLALPNLDAHMHALLNRGRGFVLVEMGRLDEGAAAYKTSLKFEPGNKLALGELAYIANLQAGGKEGLANAHGAGGEPVVTGAVVPPGYSGTPLAQKLGLKDGQRVMFLDLPDDLAALRTSSAFAEVTDGAWSKLKSARNYDLIHGFTASRAVLEKSAKALLPAITRGGTVWISWPKKASKVPTDITEDVIREVLLPTGLVDVKVAAVDEIWSGLKLVIRRELR